MTDQVHLSSDDLAAQALADAGQEMDDDSSENASMSPAVGAKVGETLTALQNVIERNVSELDALNEELKSFQDSLRNIMNNDETLAEAEEKASLLTQKVKERKSQLQVSPEVNQIKANITERKERQKEIKEALSNHFINLYQLTGAKTFDTAAGETREFDIRASVKSNKSKPQ